MRSPSDGCALPRTERRLDALVQLLPEAPSTQIEFTHLGTVFKSLVSMLASGSICEMLFLPLQNVTMGSPIAARGPLPWHPSPSSARHPMPVWAPCWSNLYKGERRGKLHESPLQRVSLRQVRMLNQSCGAACLAAPTAQTHHSHSHLGQAPSR